MGRESAPSPPAATGPNGRFHAIPRPSFATIVAQPRSFGSSTHAPAVARCFCLWRYPVVARGGIPIPKTPRRPVLDTWPRFSSARTSLAPDQVRGDGVCFLGEVRTHKSRPGAATPRRSGLDPAANARACLIDGLGTEYVPQQTGLFLGLLPIVRPCPPRLHGRVKLRALPLGREHWLPRHGRSPERSVSSVLGTTTWPDVNAAGQRMLVGRA